MVGNWKARNLDAFYDKQQWNIWGNPVLGSNISAKKYVSLCDSNLLYRIMSSVMLCYPDTSGTLYHSTWHNTSEDLNLYHIHCKDTKSHRLWLLVTKLHKVIITAVAVQVVIAFSRQGQFVIVIASFCCTADWPSVLCLTCRSASGYNDLQVFSVRSCQSCWCYRYSWRLLQWWSLLHR